MWLFIPSPKEPRLMVNRLFPCVRRISQDLAKDLAILAREIHDVAGEIDSVSSSGTAPSTTVSTAATTPGSAIDTREEVGPARPTQPDIQDSMKKVPIFLLLIALLRVFPLHSSILMFCFHFKKKCLSAASWSHLLCGIHVLQSHALHFHLFILILTKRVFFFIIFLL